MTNAGQEQGVELGATTTVEQDVAAQELREHFSDYLQRVAAGERFRVTQDGRPVALLSPAPAPTTTRAPHRVQEPMSAWDRLVAEGRIIPAKGNLLDLGLPPEPDPRYLTGISIQEALDLEREERLP